MRNKKEKMDKLKNFNPMALREKYSASSLKNKNNYSSFWLDNGWDNNSSIFDDEPVKKGVDLVALASYRRAVSNFVSIVTGMSDIKVTFKSNGDSYTDGKSVVISSKLDDKLFDSTVGLALHEGSHIKLSNFDFLKNLENEIPQEYYNRSESKGYTRYEVRSMVKDLLNYVEDRRIDHYVFTSSPGYKGYYHSLYDKYFHSKVIDKALKSDEHTDVSWDSYIFRIINLTNKNSDLNALPQLSLIRSIIFSKVKELNSTEEAFQIALMVLDCILNNLPDGVESEDEETGEVSIKKGDGDSDSDGDSSDGDSSDSSDSSDGKPKLTDNQKKQLQNAINKQKKFMDGDISKKALSKKDKASMDAVESAGMSYVDVAKDMTDRWSGKKTPTKVLMVKKFTKALAESDTISMIYKPDFSWGNMDDNKEAINKGLVMGTMLGRKLQVRGESRETKWSRKDSGRIDKRLIAELGFGNDRVFETSFVESYSDAFLHISVDASGSMSGRKWTNTMTCVSAIAKACSMINNVDCVISYRSTQSTDGNHYRRRGSKDYPLMLIAYDSRVDKISKIKNLFHLLHASGTTPEGLCFEAIMDEIVPTATNIDSFFLNFSDGMPMFSNNEISYYHETAVNHTRKMVDNIRSRGIQVLSYFIGGDYGDERNLNDFRKMYGKDAEMIDVTSVISVSKTMNKKFLEK